MRALPPIIVGILLGLAAHAAAGQDVFMWTKVDYKGVSETSGEVFTMYYQEDGPGRAIVVRYEGRLTNVFIRRDKGCLHGLPIKGKMKYETISCRPFNVLLRSIADGMEKQKRSIDLS